MFSVFGTGRIDVEALSVAFAALKRTYPVLSGRIVAVGGSGYDLLIPPPPLEPARIRGTAGPVGELPTSTEVAAAVADDEVCAVDLTQHGNDFRLTLFIRHCIADAAAGLRYLDVLCRLYTQVTETGSIGALTAHAVPHSLEEVLTARGLELPPTPAEPEVSDLRSETARPAPRNPVAGRVHLSREQTSALFSLAKRQGLTVTGIVATAVLLAAHEFTGAAGPTPFTYLSPVNLRTRLQPVVPPEGGTNILGTDAAPVLVDPNGDVYGLGRAVLDSIAANLTSRQLSLGPPPPAENMVLASNAGMIPDLVLPDGVEARDLRAMGEILDAKPPSHDLLAMPAMAVTTFSGRLSIDFQDWPTGRTVSPTMALEHAFNRLLNH